MNSCSLWRNNHLNFPIIKLYQILYLKGTAQEFKKKFETPILRGRDADATDAEHKKGKEKLLEVF